MHTTQPLLHTRRALAATALLLATFSAAELRAQVTNLSGDHRVIPQSSEPGNLDADGDLGWGRTPGSPGAVAGKLRYFDSPAQLAFDATEADAIFTWNDDATDTLRDFKMKLDANNVLSLYKTDGSAASISLTPDTGAIKLAGTGAGLFNGSGGGILQIDGSGRPYFASKPIFQDGVDFGSGGTLDDEKVGYLQGVLTNLGYDANAGSYTDVTKFTGGQSVTIVKAVHANGYIHWTGYFWGSLKLGSTTYHEGNGKYLVVKANPDGTPVWVKQVQLASSQGFFGQESIAVNASGTVVIGGAISSATTNLGAQNLTPVSGTDAYVLVLNSSGTPQWSKVLSSSAQERTYDVAIDSSGNVVAVGQFEGSTLTHESGTVSSAGGYADGFVVKYNSSGTLQWANPAGGSSYDSVRQVEIASSGNVILGGEGGTTTNMGSYNLTTAGGSDAWVASLSSAGVVQWTKGIGGVNEDNIRDLVVNSSGNVYAGSQLQGSTTNLGSYNKTSAGSADSLVTALNSSGTVQWATVIGGTGADSLGSLNLESGGSLVLGATHASTTTNLGSYNVAAGGAVIVLNSSGTVTSAQSLGSSVTINGATPLGALSSGLALEGYSAGNSSIGDTRVSQGSFLLTLPQSTISTPAAPTAAPLAWNGGVASQATGVAVGGRAFADGANSVAFGEASAIGSGSFASGTARALGEGSTAIGKDSSAFGSWSIAMGLNSNAVGVGAVAIGNGASAGGDFATALGSGYAGGGSSFAAGAGGFATGEYSVTAGEYNTSSGYSSTTFGGWNTASGIYSTALGCSTGALGDFTFSAGLSTVATASSSAVFGQLNIGGGNPVTWVETDPLFEIGNSTDYENKSNAQTTLKNGRTTLTNKAWKAAVTLDPEDVLEDPEATDDDGGDALVVEGHTRLKGKVLIEPQGDLSMEGFDGGETP